MTTEEYWFWLCGAEGIYRDTISRLLSVYETPEAIYRLGYKKLSESDVISKKLAWNLFSQNESGDFLRRLEKIKASKTDFVYYESEDFPEKLKTIPSPPYCLYVKGRLPNPNLAACAIVGARACSEYGKKEAVRFSSALAERGVQIISGMASGIDSIAQKAAIDADGSTFAVLGGGVDVIYPASNRQLYYDIIAAGGGIISEYPPQTAPAPWQFPFRNRIISGLADKLLIIEARKRSGTLSTARHALDQGRDIYALPGRVTDPLSEGCNDLIFDGAGILTDPGYIINDFFFKDAPSKRLLSGENKDREDIDETGILKYLSYHAQGADEIAKKAQMSIEDVTVKLAVLELEGRAKEVGKDFYVKI